MIEWKNPVARMDHNATAPVVETVIRIISAPNADAIANTLLAEYFFRIPAPPKRPSTNPNRITSYNVCYTKLLRR